LKEGKEVTKTSGNAVRSRGGRDGEKDAVAKEIGKRKKRVEKRRGMKRQRRRREGCLGA